MFFKIVAFVVGSILGILAGAIFAELNGMPKGGFPALIGTLFGAGGWLLASKMQKK